ncbi:dehydrogenase/reductase SDR family member 7B [Aspergillus sclerotiicarbonarius CBS 121057]|uniref:Dehydrogenase/reductase SDR family member 7B n=1 Tax=Aspergillus sclerotiicarbonarius (strain CBS 121057 / IBT 28362) TaxID=1448318 RepID=A0A319ETC8_ASPSB|nr:dehydrogenase/reductase SDR family member 7B [Aspergillus sclerotiicarbonarius CBS 121057]
MSPKTWLITGCSSGFGHQLTRTALAHNDTVIATSRDPATLERIFSNPNSNPNSRSNPQNNREGGEGAEKEKGRLIPKKLDLSGPDTEIEAFVRDVLASVGGTVDVVVNNAGYILGGAVEEYSTEEINASLRTNFTSHLTLTRALIPSMRAQHHGIIATMGSIGGWTGVPGTGIYCASKAAMAVCMEALREEIAGSGIQVVCLELGHFRTELLSERRVVRAQKRVEEVEGVGEWMRELDGRQPGDVRKGAEVIYEMLMGTGRWEGRGRLPARVPVGRNAVEVIGGVLERQEGVLREWGDWGMEVDCDDVVRGEGG